MDCEKLKLAAEAVVAEERYLVGVWGKAETVTQFMYDIDALADALGEEPVYGTLDNDDLDS